MFSPNLLKFLTHPKDDKSIPKDHDFCSEKLLLYLSNTQAISSEFGGLRSQVWLPQRSAEWSLSLAGYIYDASQDGYWNERGTTRGALCLNPWTLSLCCKRVLARYLSVESQAGRVAGREAEREREGGRALPGCRECNLQIRGRDEFLLPAWPCQGTGGPRMKLRFQDSSKLKIFFFLFSVKSFSFKGSQPWHHDSC